MSMSVNTNAGAFIALQNLTATNSQLSRTQNAINTGLKVSSAKDNAAVFAIAQNLRSDVSGLNAVKQSLDRAIGTADVAMAAGQAVSDLLVEMKERAIAAADVGSDQNSRDALDDDFQQLLAQITTIVENASFNGVNAVDGNSADFSAITALTGTKEGDTAGELQSITIASQDFSLDGLGLDTADLTTQGNAFDAVEAIEDALSTVNSGLAVIGAGAKRLEIQKTFANKLSDTIETGIGNLVDADLARESAKLQSLQVKQQLGLQALSIANQQPSAVLGLFR